MQVTNRLTTDAALHGMRPTVGNAQWLRGDRTRARKWTWMWIMPFTIEGLTNLGPLGRPSLCSKTPGLFCAI